MFNEVHQDNRRCIHQGGRRCRCSTGSDRRVGGCQGKVYVCHHIWSKGEGSCAGQYRDGEDPSHILVLCATHEYGNAECYLQRVVYEASMGGGQLLRCKVWEEDGGLHVGGWLVRAYLEVF